LVPLELLKATIVDDYSKPALVKGLLNMLEMRMRATVTDDPRP
jgi:hypothetical protein